MTNQIKANFVVLRETNIPAILLENLFIDNARDAALLRQEQFLDDLAEVIEAGAVRCLSLVKKQASTLAADIEVLQKHGIIGSPGYWLANAVAGQQCAGEYVAALIQKTAAKLREVK